MIELLTFLTVMFLAGAGLSLGFYFITFLMSILFGPPS